MTTGINLKPVKTALTAVNLPTNSANVASVLNRVTARAVADGTLSTDDLRKAAEKLAAEKNTSGVKPTKSLESVLNGALPKSLARYNFSFDPKDDPTTLHIRPGYHIPIFARGARVMAKSSGQLENNGDLKLTDEAGHVKKMLNGKLLTGRSLQQLFAHKDQDLASLKKAGFNLTEPRAILAVTIEGSAEPIFIVMRDKTSFKDQEKELGGGVMKDRTRAVAILKAHCSATIGELTAGMVAKKPVIYLYPETRTNVRVSVQIQGDFIAQYPETDHGTWNVVASPDGALFDPKAEKRYSYLFWEGTNPSGFKIDREKAFCVKSKEVASFLESACTKFGLNDKEKTDFISYWIGPMKQNPVNVVQFLSVDEYEAYAKMTVEPKPDSVIRMFMLFQRSTDLVKVGSPELPTIKRHRFTVVEWGGSNLDEC